MRLSQEEQNMVALYFGIGVSDADIAQRLGVREHTIVTTRLALGLKRPIGSRKTTRGMKYKKTKKRTFNNSKEFEVYRDYAYQLGGKNMAAIAEQHGVTREYVSQVVAKATEAECLDELGFLPNWNVLEELDKRYGIINTTDTGTPEVRD